MTGITVITPAFNAEATIESCILSVFQQTAPVDEHIIIDDGSTDRTRKIVEQIQTYVPRIKLIKQSKNGPASARNRGILEATTRYIAFLDSDDLWYPEKLTKQLAFMNKTQAALCFTAYEVFDTDPECPIRIREAPASVAYDELLDRNHIGCLTAVYDTAKVGKVYMPEIQMRQDWGLWLRIVKRSGKPALGLNQPLSKLRLRPCSLSRNKALALWYNYRLLHEFESLSPLDAVARVLKGGIIAVRGK